MRPFADNTIRDLHSELHHCRGTTAVTTKYNTNHQKRNNMITKNQQNIIASLHHCITASLLQKDDTTISQGEH
ncbi:hypothetical protein S708_003093 [Salmonella enterica subsp. houtenae]|nr:hypothetical protein [Salmonella enterica subsp. houtenae]